jgi:hypothetical protein
MLGGLATLALVLGVGAMRPGAGAQLTSSVPLAGEALIGLVAGIAFTLGAVSFAVPGATRGRALTIGAIALLTWVVLLIVGLFAPALPPSTVGARNACYLQVILFAVPMFTIGVAVLRGGYVTNGWAGGAVLGIASGALPALAMQFACMYEPLHGLEFHLAPVAFTGVLGAVAGRLVLPPRRHIES